MKHLDEPPPQEYALLFYGYRWSREEKLFEKDWPILVLERRGQKNVLNGKPVQGDGMPYEAYHASFIAWRDQNYAELEDFAEKRHTVRNEFGVDADYYGSVKHPLPCAFISDSFRSASRASPQLVIPVAKPEWNGMLRHWLDEVGIEPPPQPELGWPFTKKQIGPLRKQEPGWWLVTWWG